MKRFVNALYGLVGDFYSLLNQEYFITRSTSSVTFRFPAIKESAGVPEPLFKVTF